MNDTLWQTAFHRATMGMFAFAASASPRRIGSAGRLQNCRTRGCALERQSLLLTAPRRLEWVSEEPPPPGPDEVLVQTTAGAISIGTELPQYRGTEREIGPRGYPRMTGYESIGRVNRCGEHVQEPAMGDRVVAFYGHRTHAVVPANKAIRVPEGISDALALLAILTCDVAKGIRKLAPMPEERALITGGGAIGLLALWTLRAYGVQDVDVIEPDAHRRALALLLGARTAVAPNETSQEIEYDVGFECSSRDAGFAVLQERVRNRGRVCILADGNVEPLTLTPAFHAQELMVIGSSDGWDYQRHAAWYFERVASGAGELEAVFEERVTAAELPATFERMARGAITPVKVLVRYDTQQREAALNE